MTGVVKIGRPHRNAIGITMRDFAQTNPFDGIFDIRTRQSIGMEGTQNRFAAGLFYLQIQIVPDAVRTICRRRGVVPHQSYTDFVD